jgi:hypothetical protein
MFVWGGLFVGIYTIMLTVVGSRFKGSCSQHYGVSPAAGSRIND